MKINNKNNSNMKSLQTAILFFLWVGTTIMTIHSALSDPNENYWRFLDSFLD